MILRVRDDEVIIGDNTNITEQDLANKCDTINYEILCGITQRVPRRFIYDKMIND
ncbi:MAG: hypothetical protein E7313_06660 [Clostridiales bacterium]|nr:hypothetical protein [Clostridiales bacterium]